MSAEIIARIQFGSVTVFHFLFVPITLGLAILVAGMQTAYYRTGKDHYKRMTQFFGKLFLINFALGVVTGIVQEFQFGMNWSEYSRTVGDIFGAPLAMEGLLAFFAESTFIGLWIFGWNRLSKGVHLTMAWLVAISTNVSAYFILAANSWMQHPVGWKCFANADGKALPDFNSNGVACVKNGGHLQLTDVWRVLFQNTTVATFLHTMLAGLMIGGAVLAAVSIYHLRRKRENTLYRKSWKIGVISVTICGLLTFIVGDELAVIMTDHQPMKIAAAEGLWNTEQKAKMSLFQVSSENSKCTESGGEVTCAGKSSVNVLLPIPGALSLLAKRDFNGTVLGMNDINKTENAKYMQYFGPGDYKPVGWVSYWMWRLMIGLGILAFLYGLLAWFMTRRGKGDEIFSKRWFYACGIWLWLVPLACAQFGWIFAEMGRQPWLVTGVLRTKDGISPNVAAWTVLISLIVYVILYGIMAVIEARLMLTTARKGAEPPAEEAQAEPAPAFAY